MVDPASGPQQQQQQQQQQQAQQPPKLSITVVPLDPLDDPLDFGCESDAGGPLKPLSDCGVSHATQSIYDDLVDEVILGIVFDVHRGAKLGLTVLLEDGPIGDSHNDFDNDEATRSSTGVGGGEGVDGDLAVSDFLSAVPASNSKKPAECVCPNCQRNMAASRFAPHLEKCMGMGRNSSRLASRRIASSASRQADLASDDDFDDDDWTAGGTGDRQDRALSGDGSGSTTKKRRHHHLHKKDKNSPRRKKHRNGETNSASQSALASVPGIGIDGTESQSSNSGNAAIETMTLAERRAILSTMCGVVSEHTGRMCTRSLRCPQHTDSQRKFVRQSMLDAPPDEGSALMTDKEKDMIDVDTWEEGDSLASLLTAQSHDVPTPGAEASPAESTSTTASSTSSSAKRSQTKGAKKGAGKKMRNET